MPVWSLLLVTAQKSMDQPDKVANLARGQLYRGKKNPCTPFAPENLVSRDGFGRPIPRHTAYSFSPPRLSLLVLVLVLICDFSPAFHDKVRIYIIPSSAIASIPSSSGHALRNADDIFYRQRSACEGVLLLKLAGVTNQMMVYYIAPVLFLLSGVLA